MSSFYLPIYYLGWEFQNFQIFTPNELKCFAVREKKISLMLIGVRMVKLVCHICRSQPASKACNCSIPIFHQISVNNVPMPISFYVTTAWNKAVPTIIVIIIIIIVIVVVIMVLFVILLLLLLLLSKKTQTLADEALEKVQRTGQAKETLEQENIRLQQALQQSHRHKGSLLTSCALLAGALWPAFIRIRSLASQRNILSEYVNCLEILRQKTRTLSEMLNSEMDEKDKEKQLQSYHNGRAILKNGRRPILLFRVGVIVVLAANRIHHFSNVNSKLFVSTECPGEIGGLSVVLCGGVDKTSKPFKGECYFAMLVMA